MSANSKEKKTISKGKKIYNIVSTILVLAVFVFLIVVIGVVMYQRKHNGDAKLFGYYMFNVISNSMEPTVNVGDVILAKEVDDVNALKEGDVITFTAPSGDFNGYNITHRIVEVVKNDDGTVKYFKTKGDNPEAPVDSWKLSPTEVKAKFVRVSKFITGFRNFISKWYGFVILILIPLLLVGVLLIVGYVRDKTAEMKEAEASAAISADDLTDEQKRKLLEDYLASAPTGEGSAENGDNSVTDTPAENKEQSAQNSQSERVIEARGHEISDGKSSGEDAPLLGEDAASAASENENDGDKV